MADVQIGPSVVSIPRRNIEFPSTSPVIEATGKSLGQFHEMAQQLLEGAQRQAQANQNANVLISYANKQFQLQRNIAGVQDYQTKLNLYRAGLENIHDELGKEYPSIYPAVSQNLHLQMMRDYQDQALKYSADKVKLEQSETKYALKNLTSLAINATDDNTRKLAEAHGLALIDSGMTNGFYHPEEAQFMKQQLVYDVAKGKYDNQVASNPNGALKITFQDSHLHWNDWYTGHVRALALSKSVENTSDATFKQQKANAINAVQSAPVDQRAALAERYRAFLPEGMYKAYHPPLTHDEFLEASNYIHKFVGTEDQFNNWVFDNVDHANWDTEDGRTIRDEVTRKRAALKDDFSIYKSGLEKSLDQYMDQVDTSYKMVGSDLNANFRAQVNLMLANAYKSSTNYDDANKQFTTIAKEIVSYFKSKGYPIPPLPAGFATLTPEPPAPPSLPTPPISLPPGPGETTTPVENIEPITRGDFETSATATKFGTTTPAGHTFRPELAAAQLHEEDPLGDPNAVSPKGAIGIAQFMPATAERYGISPEQLTDPEISIWLQHRYMNELLDRYDGDEFKALAAYVSGPGRVDKGEIVPEARRYAEAIIARANRMASTEVPTPESTPTTVAEAATPEATPTPEASTTSESTPTPEATGTPTEEEMKKEFEE
jgi:hypothetical protein